MEPEENIVLNGLAEEEKNLLSKYWCPYTIIYDPLRAGSIDGTDKEPHDKAIVRALNATYRPNYKAHGKSECTIFVARLDHRTTEITLRENFSKFGRIVNCRIVQDMVTGRSKGYAFIEFETEKAAMRAYRGGYRMYIEGSQILVDRECGRFLPGWIPRRLGGGFNGKKESGQLRFGCRERPFKKPINLLRPDEILCKFDDKLTKPPELNITV